MGVLNKNGVSCCTPLCRAAVPQVLRPSSKTTVVGVPGVTALSYAIALLQRDQPG